MPEALDRIARLRELLPANVRLQVDGGINQETARAARDAGAGLLVAGSAIFWKDDPAAAYAELVSVVRDRPMPDDLLELRGADGAVERIDEWLASRGFFSGDADDLVADLYLGYGLSERFDGSGAPRRRSPARSSRSPRAVFAPRRPRST